jgi:hypothetical protein
MAKNSGARNVLGRWSREETNRTIDEVKRRSLVDPDFRALALSNPVAAIARINPKPLPLALSIKFVEGSAGADASSSSVPHFTIILPEPVAEAAELSDLELEQAAGGKTDVEFPID